jgi:hypothetical protein
LEEEERVKGSWRLERLNIDRERVIVLHCEREERVSILLQDKAVESSVGRNNHVQGAGYSDRIGVNLVTIKGGHAHPHLACRGDVWSAKAGWGTISSHKMCPRELS